MAQPLARLEWVVYAKPPFGGADHVLEYLGRYTHRVAISNQRLLWFDGAGWHFSTRTIAFGQERKPADDAGGRRVYPPLSVASVAARVSSASATMDCWPAARSGLCSLCPATVAVPTSPLAPSQEENRRCRIAGQILAAIQLCPVCQLGLNGGGGDPGTGTRGS